MKIERIVGREIYDSAGWPTVQCDIFLDDGSCVPHLFHLEYP